MDVWHVTAALERMNHERSNRAASNHDSGTFEELQTLLAEPARRLRAGQVIAFPTETVYGLGANACDEAAVQKIFRAKGRPSDNPLIVHIADESQLSQVVANPESIPDAAHRLMEAFWPGPLTIILPAHPSLAASVHPGLDTVGVRVPDHPVARALIAAAGCPVAAPSANSSGRPSPTNAETVQHDLDGKIDGIVDGGSCNVGLESTVVAVSDDEGVVYRPGWITLEELSEAAGIPFTLDPHLRDVSNTDPAEVLSSQSVPPESLSPQAGLSQSTQPKSPGMKYRHYAPDAEVIVWFGHHQAVVNSIETFVRQHEGDRIALICPADFPDVGDVSARWSPDANEAYEVSLGRELYNRLRWGDEIGVSTVLVVGVEPTGRGLALMNRLQKASEGRLYRV